MCVVKSFRFDLAKIFCRQSVVLKSAKKHNVAHLSRKTLIAVVSGGVASEPPPHRKLVYCVVR